jgi:hypothetical protein
MFGRLANLLPALVGYMTDLVQFNAELHIFVRAVVRVLDESGIY